MEPRLLMDRHKFDLFFETLRRDGYRLIGPKAVDEAIVYAGIDSTKELPAGLTDEQQGGTYRLKPSGNPALFGYSVAPQSWKKFLFLPTLRLWEARRGALGIQFAGPEIESGMTAFIGVRACEIKAMEIQDRILLHAPYPDTTYVKLRENTLIVAVQCGKSADTCFCRSMDAGPEVTHGFDILLTEVADSDRHFFIVEKGTGRGAEIVNTLGLQEAGKDEQQAAERLVAKTAATMGRVLDQTGIKELLYRNYEHPRWAEVAKRCLTCTNCTMVCPTCFCATVEDLTDLTGQKAERWRRWDSCFTLDHSYLHNGCVRCSGISRYRQWMTHKLATWIDQFGTSGCVGCGRCITWCPVGIDITEEVSAIRSSGDAGSTLFGKKGD